MRHVAAHLWAELDSLPAAKRRAINKHAQSCDSCAAARDRIGALESVFADIRAAEPEGVEWDHVGARIHWSRSLERRTGERAAIVAGGDDERRWGIMSWVLGGSAAAALVAAAAVLIIAPWRDAPLTAPALPAEQAIVAVPVQLSTGAELEALAVMVRGEATIDGSAPDWNRPIVAGQRIETGAGELVAQFARGGGFALGPSSSLELRSFDSHSIELVLEGTLDVQVSRRDPDQQFIVVAGERTVSVRGTAFRVSHRGGDLDVACEHGRVEVTEGTDIVGIDGRQRLVVEGDAPLSDGAAAVDLGEVETAALAAELAMPLISAWRDVADIIDATSTLSIVAADDAAVKVDGMAIGVGPMGLRLLAGRHEVTVGDSGPWSKGRWIDLDGGPGDVRIVHALGPQKADKSERIRRVQLRLALRESSVQLGRCVSRLASHDVARGAFVDLEVSVNADGTLGAVNAGASNIDLRVRRCVLDTVSSLRLPRGPRGTATVRWRF